MYWVVCLGTLLGIENGLMAQPCFLTFSPNPGPASVTIEAYYALNRSYTSPLNLALFKDTVTTGNSTVPAGT